MNQKVVDLIESQRYDCITAIVPSLPVIRQNRELRARYGYRQWIVGGRGPYGEMLSLRDKYMAKLSHRVHEHNADSEGDGIYTLYFGVKSPI